MLILTGANKIRYHLIYSLIATVSILSNTELRSTVFWLAGGPAYSLPNSLFIISIAITVYLLYINNNNSFLFFINLLLIPFINGLSESIMVSYTTFIIIISFIDTALRDFNRNTLRIKIAFSVLAIISALVVYLCPGNTIRTSIDGVHGRNIALSLIQSFISIFKYVFDWINPLWICFVALIVLLSYKSLTSQIEIIFKDKKIFSVIIISLVFSLYMSYFVRWYSLGGEGPLRSNSTSYTIFITITTFLSLYISLNLDWRWLENSQLRNRTFITITALLCCFSFIANQYHLKHDFRLLKSHYEYYQTNYPLIIKAKKNSHIELPLEPRVKILRWKCYLTEDKYYWINREFASYFNLKSVTSVSGGGPDPDSPNTNGECGGT